MKAMQSKNHFATLFLFISIAVLMVLITACGPSTAEPPVPTTAPTEESAPALAEMPTVPPVSEAYPPPLPTLDPANPYPEGEVVVPPVDTPPDAYPPSAAEEVFLEPRFRIDPASAGATTVAGQAPPNLAIAILDVTYNGEVLGVGRTDENGRFEIPVSGLIEGNRIGVTVGELQPGQTLTAMAEQYFPYRGEGFMNVPNVGILFDTVLVQP